MLLFNKTTLLMRGIFFVILVCCTFFASFWVFVILGIFALFLFPLYFEIVFFVYIRESLLIFDRVSFLYLGITLALVGSVYWLRTQIRL